MKGGVVPRRIPNDIIVTITMGQLGARENAGVMKVDRFVANTAT